MALAVGRSCEIGYVREGRVGGAYQDEGGTTTCGGQWSDVPGLLLHGGIAYPAGTAGIGCTAYELERSTPLGGK